MKYVDYHTRIYLTNKILLQPTSDPYAFIEFAEHQAAANALLAMNKRLVMGKEIKVNWATASTVAVNKIDTSSKYIYDQKYVYFLILCTEHHHIFVGDLAPEIDQNALHDAFSPFGEIS
jgi:nucleolysin TIA-1/TIAR